MKKLLFFARDPGAANCLVPVINRCISNYDVIVYAKDVAFKRFLHFGINVRMAEKYCFDKGIKSLVTILKDIAPDAVITGTSVDDYTERYLWKGCAILGIPAIAVIDQWTNLGIRFSRFDYLHENDYAKELSHDFLPTSICVMDDLAKNMIVGEGIEDDRIIVTGQPHFDMVRQYFEETNAEVEPTTVITFVSEPIFRDYDNFGSENYWGFNEFTIFDELIEVLVEKSDLIDEDFKVIVRPHPRDDLKMWEDKLASIQNMNVLIDSDSTTYELLKKSSLVCGMSSMMLLEAAICDVPIMSIMIGLKRANPFVLNNIGICPSITDRESLEENMETFIRGEYNKISKFINIEHATENVLDVIEEAVKNG